MRHSLPADCIQLLHVLPSGAPNEHHAAAILYEKTEGGWQEAGRWPAVIGRHGWAPIYGEGEVILKKEGDGKSPAGVFRLGPAFGYADQSPSSYPYWQIGVGSLCIDDPASIHYNRIADARHTYADWQSAEEMLRKDGLYELGLEVEYPSNHEVPKGSCIFIHIWRSAESGTSGCIALSRADLLELIKKLNAEANPAIAILPAAEFSELLYR